MAHTDACKIEVCQYVKKKISEGVPVMEAFQMAELESDGIPAKTVERWYYSVKNELAADPSPKNGGQIQDATTI